MNNNPIGTEVLINCGTTSFPEYILMKLVSKESCATHENKMFFYHDELPNVEVYIGDVRGDIASIISKNPVPSDNFPNAIKVGLHTEVKILGWNT
jgi:hypothetical protein